MKISVVSPVYMGEKMVKLLVETTTKAITSIDCTYEIILVNDASPDNSWNEILKCCQIDKNVKGIDLSRNFGQHKAIVAGLSKVTGDWIVVMDCDLQDNPNEIPKLLNKALEGYEIVQAQRENRKDNIWKRLSSKTFHTIYRILSGMKTDEKIANFGIYARQVIDQINKMPETSRSFVMMIDYLGYRRTTVPVIHQQRATGKSSYTIGKLIKLATDVIITNTNRPLQWAVNLGFAMSTISFILALYNIVAKLYGIIEVPGYTTTIFSIWFVGGLLLMMLGILGLYIGKIFDLSKQRPLFVVRQSVNC